MIGSKASVNLSLFRNLFVNSFLFFCHTLMGVDHNGSDRFTLDSIEPFVYSSDAQTIIAKGDAVLRGPNLLIQADEIKWDKKNSFIFADGSVIISNSNYRVLLEDAIIDISKGTFTGKKVTTGKYPWVVTANELKANENETLLTSAEIKHENHTSESPFLSSTEVKFDTNNSKLTVTDFGLQLKDFTLMRIPEITLNTQQNIPQIDFLLGKQVPLGWFAGARIHLSPRDQLQSSLGLQSYFDHGLYVTPELELEMTETSAFEYQFYSIKLGGIRDHGDKTKDSLGDSVNVDRGFARISSILNKDENWHFAIMANPSTDSEFYKNYERDLFTDNQWVENFAELTYDGDFLSMSILADMQVNNYESQLEKKPSLELLGGPHSWWHKNFHDTIKVELCHLGSEGDDLELTPNTELYDFSYRSGGIFKVTDLFQYSPSATYRSQNFKRLDTQRSNRDFFEFQNTLTYDAFSPVDSFIPSPRGDNFFHFLKVSLQHSHMEELRATSTDEIIVSNDRLINPYLENFDLFELRETDEFEEIDIVRLGMENSLTGLNARDGMHEIASVLIYQDLWVNEDTNDTLSKYFYGILKLAPHPNLAFNYYTKIDTKLGLQLTNNLNILLKDGNINEFSISYLDFDDSSENIQYFSRHLIRNKNSVEYGLRYNPDGGDIPYWVVSFQSKIINGWKINAVVSNYNSEKRKETRWALKFNAFSF